MFPVAEFEVEGKVVTSFLRKSEFSHTITITLTDEDIECIKTIVKTSPGFAENNFRWPIVGKDVKFVSKVNLDEDYENIWDGRSIANIYNVDARQKLIPDDIKAGTNVLLEYSITQYIGRKPKENVSGYNSGCTLTFLSIGLLPKKKGDIEIDFDSPKKKRRLMIS